MIDDCFFRIARKILSSVYEQRGQETILPKNFWLRQGIYCTSLRCVITPSDVRLRAAFAELVRNNVVKFRDISNGYIGITMNFKYGDKDE